MSVQEFHVLVLGRGVYALPLLRILGHGETPGIHVHVTLCTTVGLADVGSCSSFIDAVAKLPRPDHDLEAYAQAVCHLAKGKPNIVLIPVGEEAMYLSQIADRIREECSPNKPEIVCSSPEVLIDLHEKYQFQKLMATVFSEQKLPRTTLVHRKEDLLTNIEACFKKDKSTPAVVLKPLIGRGGRGSSIVSREDFESLSAEELIRHVKYTGNKPFVVQEFVEGRELSTYSLCRNGEVVVHLCYIPKGVSASQGFASIRTTAPAAQWKNTLEYVKQVAKTLNLTGHFGFDMMERFTGELVALECNARVTNGVAFFAPRFSVETASEMKRALLGLSLLSGGVLGPRPGPNPQRSMSSIPALFAILNGKTSSEKVALLELATRSFDDIWWYKDPLPFVCTMLRLVFWVILAVLKVLFGGSKSVEAALQQFVADELIEFEKISEASVKTDVETVGGQESPPTTRGGGKGLKVLVTGATGFLGGRLVRILNQGYEDGTELPSAVSSVTQITATGRDEKKGQALIDSLIPNGKARFVSADLSNSEETYRLVQGHDVVFHSAALCSLWTRWEDYISANVTAAQNIAHACHLSGTVRLLVHVSSPSLCISVDTGDRFNAKEDDPLPSDEKQPNRYAATKKMAEVIVREVARRFSLPCIVIRPRAIFGPGDTTLFPLIVDRLRKGKLPIIGGKGAVGDYTHVDNVVYACLCCLDKAPTSSKVYSITNDDPRPLWDVISAICTRLKLKHPWKRVPRWLAYAIGSFCDGLAVVMLLCGIKRDPLLTRYTVNVLSRSSTFDISAAKKELGYKVVVPFDDAINRFLDSVESSH